MLLTYFSKILIICILTWFLVNNFFNHSGTVPFLVSLVSSFSIAIFYLYNLGLTFYIILVYFIYLTIFPVFFLYACNFLGLLKPIKSSDTYLLKNSNTEIGVKIIFSILLFLLIKVFLYLKDVLWLNLFIQLFTFGPIDLLPIFSVIFNTHSQLALILGTILLVSLVGLLTILSNSTKYFNR